MTGRSSVPSRPAPHSKRHNQHSIDSLIQLDASRKGSHQGEETEHSDEQKLEVIATQSKRVFLFHDVGTLVRQDLARFGRSSQECGDGGALLAFQLGQTIIVHKDSVLGKTGLGSLLVVERGWGGSVDGGVEKDWFDDLSGGSATDLPKTERLGTCRERRVSLACWWGLRLS